MIILGDLVQFHAFGAPGGAPDASSRRVEPRPCHSEFHCIVPLPLDEGFLPDHQFGFPVLEFLAGGPEQALQVLDFLSDRLKVTRQAGTKAVSGLLREGHLETL